MTNNEARVRILELLREDDDARQAFLNIAVEAWNAQCIESGCSEFVGEVHLLQELEEDL